jgi:heme/copper-type cytochrome/quinol oxidase subunit 2
MSMETLDPGAYYLIKSGDKDTRYDVRVLNTAEVQTINLRDSYIVHYIIYAAACLLGIVLLTVLIVRRVRNRKKQNAEIIQNQT